MSLDFCIICSENFFMTPERTCQTSCPARYYTSNYIRSCVKCRYDCYSCAKRSVCLTCNSTTDFRVLSKNGKRCLPMVGYFDNSTTVCVKCPSGCFSCKSLIYCTSCTQNYFLNSDNLCYSSCPSRSYQNPSSKYCQICHYTCESCSSPISCTACNSTYDFRVLNTTLSKCICKTGYF